MEHDFIIDYSTGKALFMVNTPFQALCAIEVINRYSIIDYDLIVAYFSNENRLNQIYTILSLYSISYTPLLLSKYAIIKYLLKLFFSRNRYTVAFIGDFYTILSSFISVLSLKRGSRIIYLDDGNSTIDIFKNRLAPDKVTNMYTLIRSCVKFIAKTRYIEIEKYFFSIFSVTDNCKYSIIENDFSFIQSVEKDRNYEIESFFVGTVTDAFCKENGIIIEHYYNILEIIFSSIYKNRFSITYIPHGRDNDYVVKKLCSKYNIEYRTLDVCLELYLLKNIIRPKCLIGFSSSALYTVKRMFPETKVFNIQIISSNPSNEYIDIADYYNEHGIENVIFKV